MNGRARKSSKARESSVATAYPAEPTARREVERARRAALPLASRRLLAGQIAGGPVEGGPRRAITRIPGEPGLRAARSVEAGRPAPFATRCRS